jgi:hypothetical protein
MNGAIPLLPMYAFVAGTETTLPFIRLDVLLVDKIEN